MLRFGIRTRDQYLRAGKHRRWSGARVAFRLLSVGENPSREDIEVFEDINFTLRTSNGTCRTTFRHRLNDVDEAAINILQRIYPSDFPLCVEDRAASHGLTSLEFARPLFSAFPNATFEASDRLLHLIEISLPNGESFVLEPEGRPLQYVRPPFVVGLAERESRYLPINQLVAVFGKRRLSQLLATSPQLEAGKRYRVSKISCVHPEVVAFQKANPSFQINVRSVFDVTAAGIHLLRTMNILNGDYFSEAVLREGADSAFQSLRPRGVWVVGRTLESDLSNHVSFLQKLDDGWQLLGRIGKGSDMEQLVNFAHPTTEVPSLR